jgi:hypothetical protein
MMLSERQQLARSLACELGKLNGAWIINSMPLDENAKLRIQVLECDRNTVFQAVQDWGFEIPAFVSMQPRVTHNGMALACVYEINIPKPQQAIIDDRRIPTDEIADPQKKAAMERETMLMRKACGLK